MRAKFFTSAARATTPCPSTLRNFARGSCRSHSGPHPFLCVVVSGKLRHMLTTAMTRVRACSVVVHNPTASVYPWWVVFGPGSREVDLGQSGAPSLSRKGRSRPRESRPHWCVCMVSVVVPGRQWCVGRVLLHTATELSWVRPARWEVRCLPVSACWRRDSLCGVVLPSRLVPCVAASTFLCVCVAKIAYQGIPHGLGCVILPPIRTILP